MAEDDVLAKALADVRRRRADLQAEYERVNAELIKLNGAERSLAAIVEGTSLPAADERLGARATTDGGLSERQARTGRRGPRGPRANSGKGRLRALLDEAGQDGIAQDQIARRLADVATPTLNAYLSSMISSGEVVRSGDVFTATAPKDTSDAETKASDDLETDERASQRERALE